MVVLVLGCTVVGSVPAVEGGSGFVRPGLILTGVCLSDWPTSCVNRPVLPGNSLRDRQPDRHCTEMLKQSLFCNVSIFISSSHLWHHIDCLVPRRRPPKRRPDVVRLLPVRRLGRRRSLPPGRLHDLVLPQHRPRDPEKGEQLLLLQAGQHRHAAGPARQPRQECTSVKKRLSVPLFIN